MSSPRNSMWQWQSDTEFQGYLDWVFRKVVTELEKQGYLTAAEAKDIDDRLGLVIVKKGMFGKMIDKVLGLTDAAETSYNLRLVDLNLEANIPEPPVSLTIVKDDRMNKLDTEE